ncbi:hypothetical protein NQ318_003058 [Aromia moschata]|uniref:O-acyltransferase n=1 Tax=Aromia moschata TaxID=1265417 RepID=A0AAV8Y2U5_9CUCU|nr:hypothetical protein NQ318_003058 [Aromia moschata]
MSPNVSNITTDHSKKREEKNCRSVVKNRQLPEKKFELRNSLLTDLFESNQHIKTIYHVFIATLICLFVNTLIHDYAKKGEINIEFRLIYWGFGKLYITIIAWIGFFVDYMFVLRVLWCLGKTSNIRTWDCLWALSLLSYYILCFRIASLIVTTFQLPIASASIVLLEQVRFLMKIHAFVRSNVRKVLDYKPHSDQPLNLPDFSKFFYFIFAPTLIYRDEYPRTKEIRWNFIVCRILEVTSTIFYYSFLLNRFLLPFYKDFCMRKFTWSEIIISVFENSTVGILLLLATFFMLLHSVQNIFAELLRFGDRLFYKDWWTCTSYSEYFRTWNIVVHDWLYTYVYKDMYEIVTPRCKIAARFAVLILSATVHEWVLTYMFGFFFPALFVQFVFGGSLLSSITPPKTTILNVLFWYELSVGSGSLVSMYTLEFYARNNSPMENPSFRDYILPRFFTCNCIE